MPCLDWWRVSVRPLLAYVVDADQLSRTLDQRAARVRAYCWAKSTWKTKASQWRKYIAFCTMLIIPVVPTAVDNMCRFVVYLSDLSDRTNVNVDGDEHHTSGGVGGIDGLVSTLAPPGCNRRYYSTDQHWPAA